MYQRPSVWFEWGYDGEHFEKIGKVFDTTKYSDEYCKYGEFTGAFVRTDLRRPHEAQPLSQILISLIMRQMKVSR